MARSLSPIGVQQDLSGRIFDIQSYSVHDGPGCRTLVFLSGCPLRCEWCANPEGLENRVRTLFRVMKCINRTQGCTRCIPKCPHQAISISDEKEIPLAIDWEKCRHCESHECVDACLQAGFAPERLLLDPGFGFGKTLQHNIDLMRDLQTWMAHSDYPVLIGVSRKTMLGQITGIDIPEERMVASVAAALASIARGAHIVRVHDVKETVQAVKIWQELGVWA